MPPDRGVEGKSLSVTEIGRNRNARGNHDELHFCKPKQEAQLLTLLCNEMCVCLKTLELNLAKKIMYRLINNEAYITMGTQGFHLDSLFFKNESEVAMVDPVAQFLGAHQKVVKEQKKNERKQRKRMANFEIAANKVKNTGMKPPVLDDDDA